MTDGLIYFILMLASTQAKLSVLGESDVKYADYERKEDLSGFCKETQFVLSKSGD